MNSTHNSNSKQQMIHKRNCNLLDDFDDFQSTRVDPMTMLCLSTSYLTSLRWCAERSHNDSQQSLFLRQTHSAHHLCRASSTNQSLESLKRAASHYSIFCSSSLTSCRFRCHRHHHRRCSHSIELCRICEELEVYMMIIVIVSHSLMCTLNIKEKFMQHIT